MTREEELWAAIVAALNGDDVDVPVPAWRREEFLVGILGAIKGVEGASVPEPVWREEQYLKAMFDTLAGGAGSSYKLLAKEEFTYSTTSTSYSSVGEIDVGSEAYDSSKIIYVRVRDKAGIRDGYFIGSDVWFVNQYEASGGTSTATKQGMVMIGKGFSIATSAQYGVYVDTITSAGKVTVSARYSSAYGTIDGTYVVEVYALEWPDRVSPFVTVS